MAKANTSRPQPYSALIGARNRPKPCRTPSDKVSTTELRMRIHNPARVKPFIKTPVYLKAMPVGGRGGCISPRPPARQSRRACGRRRAPAAARIGPVAGRAVLKSRASFRSRLSMRALFLLLLCVSLPAHADGFLSRLLHQPVPGGVAVVDLGDGPRPSRVTFQD